MANELNEPNDLNDLNGLNALDGLNALNGLNDLNDLNVSNGKKKSERIQLRPRELTFKFAFIKIIFSGNNWIW
jgi:hypothetical protein